MASICPDAQDDMFSIFNLFPTFFDKFALWEVNEGQTFLQQVTSLFNAIILYYSKIIIILIIIESIQHSVNSFLSPIEILFLLQQEDQLLMADNLRPCLAYSSLISFIATCDFPR